MNLSTLYTIAKADRGLQHPCTKWLAVYAPEADLWTPPIRTYLAAILGSSPAAFPALYARLSGEERETLRLVYDSLHAPDSPRQRLCQQLGIDPTLPLNDTLPAFIRHWSSWWQASAAVKPLPEALGSFAIGAPAIETAFVRHLFPTTDLRRTFLAETETHRKQWEAVLLPYAARLDLIAQGTRQALRQWHTLQDQLLFSLTNNKD